MVRIDCRGQRRGKREEGREVIAPKNAMLRNELDVRGWVSRKY
jgi:hypothetical protein